LNTAAMAEGFISDASYSLEEARQSINRGIYHRAVRRAQECVELSLKATLRLLGVEYPRQHEVGELVRRVIVERASPEWFLSELPTIVLISKRLVESRGPAFYGDEAAFTPPRNLRRRTLRKLGVERNCVVPMSLCAKWR